MNSPEVTSFCCTDFHFLGYERNMWIIYPYVQERDVFLKKGRAQICDVTNCSLVLALLLFCFRLQCVLSRLSENWSFLRKPKVWPLFNKLEGRKCSNRGKITRNPQVLSVQFENTTCLKTLHSLYWKHKQPFLLFLCTVKINSKLLLAWENQLRLLFENRWKYSQN